MKSIIKNDFFLQHDMKVNKVVIRLYYVLCLLPIIVSVLSFNGLYNYNKWLSVAGIVISLSLALLLFILQKKSETQKSIKYVLLFALQFIIFLYSIDVNIQMTVLYAVVPLLALAYFDPMLELSSSICATLSLIIGTIIISKDATIILYPGISQIKYLLTTGIGRLLEFTFVDIVLYEIAVLARSIMDNLWKKNEEEIAIRRQTIVHFADLMESRDDITGEHVKRTAQVVKLITKYIEKHNDILQLKITDSDELDNIASAAPLHDIGKMRITDLILQKPGKLTDDEFNIIKTHTIEGGKIIDTVVKDMNDPAYYKVARDMAYYHHEKWNGTGYPEKISGENIPLSARIMAVADVLDALCSKRSYKEAFSIDDALQIMIDSKGSHFEPILVDVLLELKPELKKIYV